MVNTKLNGFRLSALAGVLCLSMTGVYAAGLGKITVLSPLGQPLRAEIDVNASQEELASMNARLASPEAFRQVGIDYAPGIAGIRFSLDKRKDGQSFLRMTTERPVSEPFLDVLVEMTWSSGRMVREYTVLLDPPEALTSSVPAPVAAPKSEKPKSTSVAVAPRVEKSAVEPTPGPAQSSAAPAKAVEPAPKSRPESTGGNGDEHLIKRGDTLAKIAVSNKPEGVSLDQMLVALYKGNPEAFEGGNMNRLRAGKILTIPDAQSAAAVSNSEARQLVMAQAKDFNAYRGKLAANVAAAPAKNDTLKQADQGKIAPRVVEKPASGEPPTDKLEVSRTQASKDQKALQGRITALEEDLVARDRALKEANSRVADLERNIADLKKLAELKNEAGAKLQAQAEAAKAVPETKPVAVPPPPAPVEKPAEVKEPAATTPAQTPVPEDKPAEAAKPSETAAAPADGEKAGVKPEATKTVEPPAPVPVNEPSFIDDNPLLVYGGAGVLVALLGYLGFAAKKRRNGQSGDVPTSSQLSEGDLMANSVFGSTGGQSVDTSASIQTDFSQASLSAIDADEGVDPVAEADVYMAYGRDAQAEEILLEALKTDPSRLAISLKLLEIYSGQKNLGKFEGIAQGLKNQTGGMGGDWDKACAMGRALDPANPLYSGEGASPEPELAMPEIPEPKPEPVSIEQPIVNPMADLASAPSNLDFDLELGTDLDTPSATEPASEPTAAPAPLADTAPTIDISLPEVEPSQSLEASPAVVEEPDNLGGLDFEFDLDTPAPAPAPSVPQSAASVDFSGINLDLVTSDAPHDDIATVDTLDADGDNPDVTTKIELAQAYEEMGDREGARELLEEVLQEGSAAQKEIARSKIAALDA